jgi:hypothetical protein
MLFIVLIQLKQKVPEMARDCFVLFEGNVIRKKLAVYFHKVSSLECDVIFSETLSF